MIKNYLLGAGIILLMTQCAVNKPSYAQDEEERLSLDDLPKEGAYFTLYAVGDAGKATDINKKTMSLLSTHLDTAEGRDAVVFLGDNIYPSGMPDSTHKDREISEKYLQLQIDAVKPYESTVFFVAGNHDWKRGLPSIRREKAYLEKHLKDQVKFLPDPGCGGPVAIQIKSNLVMLLLDSEWWMQNWNEHPGINEGCKVRNRDQYLDELENMFQIYQEQTIIVAMHHPPFTFGSHGGQFSVNQMFFPLRDLNPSLYIPFPFGSILRRNAGVRSDNAYPPFVAFKKGVLDRAEGYENIIFVAGHEHNLQYIEENGHPFIVSGAGAKQTPGKAGGPALYTSGQGGFASLKFYEDGSVYALYHNATSREIDFITQVRGARDSLHYINFDEYNQIGDTVTASILKKNDKVSRYRHLSWGKAHRDLYYKEVNAKVLRFSEMKGGINVVNNSGNARTNVLRVRDYNGNDYLIRAIRKNRDLGVGTYTGTRFEEVLSEVYSFTHPYAPVAIPPMAESLGIYHTNARLFYMPHQPTLSIYNGKFGSELYIFEDSPSVNPSPVKSFGEPDSITTTFDMLKKEEQIPNYKIDRKHYLRNRLFDMIIGDWDRKETNWYWAEFNPDSANITLARPVPYNRDQAFSSFDGLFPQLANKSNPSLRQFQSFGTNIPRINWYNNYARFLDDRILPHLNWEDWEREVRYIQTHLTDEIIEEAVRQMPPEIFEMGGEKIIENIKARRENMTDFAKDYFTILIEDVEVLGTNNEDEFKISRLNNGDTKVEIKSRDKSGSNWVNRYNETFDYSETKEIHLYGLGGDDQFIIEGSGSDGIKVRIIGGHGNDKTVDSSQVNDLVKKTLIYDYKDGMEIIAGPETVKKLSRQYNRNNYNHKDYNKDYFLIWPTSFYNRDQGFNVGGVMNYRLFTFKRDPFAQDHRVSADISIMNKSALLEYQGIFTKTIANLDILLNFRVQSPNYRITNFGIGNETVQYLNEPLEYHQYEQEEIYFSGGIKYDYADGGYVSLSPFYRTVDIGLEDKKSSELSSAPPLMDDRIFSRTHFSGVEAKMIYDSRNVPIAPTLGMKFKTILTYSNNLEANQSVGNIESNISFYQIVSPHGNLVWATLMGVEHVIGNFLFYQSATVGGPSSIRGLRMDRFRGNTSFWNSNDLRYNFGPVRNSLVPFDFGIIGSFDHGRVWAENERSNTYHLSAGGGLFFIIMDLTTLNVSYHKGAERGQLLFGLNFDF